MWWTNNKGQWLLYDFLTTSIAITITMEIEFEKVLNGIEILDAFHIELFFL